MAHGYTFQREGEGYRFLPDAAGQAEQSGGSVLWIVIFGTVALGALTVEAFLVTVIALGLAGWQIYKQFKARAASSAAAARVQQGRAGFLVTPAAIVTQGGERIAASRINSLKIKNEMDGLNASFADSRTYEKAGTIAADIDAAQARSRRKRTMTAFIVTVQHGPAETVLARRMNENGAEGLRADIGRVLAGQRLA